MKRCVIIVLLLLCTLTLTACKNAPKTESGINPTTASVKITLESGGENSIWDELTSGAVAFRQWIDGFETESAASVPKDGRSYTIELTFGAGTPVSYRYMNCGERGCYLSSEDGWLAVKNPSPMPIGYVREFGLYVRNIVKVEHANGGGTTKLELSDKDKTTLSEWLGGLKYEYRWFPKGEAPGDCDGGEVYTFTFADGELSYVNNGENERYLHFGTEWYGISNPSDIPIKF